MSYHTRKDRSRFSLGSRRAVRSETASATGSEDAGSEEAEQARVGNPIRGIVIGLGIATVVWAVIAIVVWLIVR